MAILTSELIARLHDAGVECFLPAGSGVPDNCRFEAPCSIKWMNIQYDVTLGAFSYAVSGYFFNVAVGRYTSIGEEVQIGRGDHPTTWVSTSPAFYIANLFNVGSGFEGAQALRSFQPRLPAHIAPTTMKLTTIGHDVYIGHGAFVRPGVTIGHGAIVGAHAVVVKDVPPYAVVAGNPATVRKFRVPVDLIDPLLALEWWRFAPWQLAGVDFTDPRAAVRLLESICPKLRPFQPRLLSMSDLIVPADHSAPIR